MGDEEYRPAEYRDGQQDFCCGWRFYALVCGLFAQKPSEYLLPQRALRPPSLLFEHGCEQLAEESAAVVPKA